MAPPVAPKPPVSQAAAVPAPSLAQASCVTAPAAETASERANKALLYCALLALQFGLQPLAAARFTAAGVSKSSLVISTELVKISFAVAAVLGMSAKELRELRESWTLVDSLRVAALPACLYAIQNLLVQYGYSLLDSMTFNLLNQTKTLSAAFWLYLIMGQAQSAMQMVALLMLLAAAALLNWPSGANDAPIAASDGHQLGVLVVIAASMISGLSGALTQKVLVGAKPRPTVFYSAELAVYGIALLLVNLVLRGDGASLGGDGDASSNLWANWDVYTLIPVVMSACGGMAVAQVTKYAGCVVKGFALIAGIVVTGVAQWLLEGKALGSRDAIAVVLVSASIYLHSKYPAAKKAPAPDKKSQ